MFRNRGSVPDINPSNNGNNIGGNFASSHGRYFRRRYIIIHYDKTFLAMELAMTLIILITAFAAYIFTYKVPFNDPLASMKSNFLTSQLISIVISLVLTGIATFLAKSKETLIKLLRIIALISILILFVHLGVKSYIDNKYTDENIFKEFYETYEAFNVDEEHKNISIGLSGMKITNPEEDYIEDSIKAYNNFKAKTIFYIILHILVIVFVFYLSSRLSSIEEKKEKLSKDDAILFDEEENIKY